MRQKLSILQRIVIAGYGVVVLTLILLAASNYPVQWKVQVNHERERYVEVIAQAIRYYTLDHAGVMPELPEEPVVLANTHACRASCPSKGGDLPCFDLQTTLVPGYMKEMLQDPLYTSDTDTGFYLERSGREVRIGACYTYFGQDVSVREVL